MRARTLSAILCSLTITTMLAVPALGANVGGTPVVSAGANTHSAKKAAPLHAVPPLHTAPIVAHTARLSYSGPVYEKTATGALLPYQAPLAPGHVNGATGGSPVGASAQAKPQLLVPGSIARFVNGLAAAPMSAPATVQEVIWAGNQIIGLPYIFGGGHGSFTSPGYDCSGTVSFALHGASLLATPADSSEFMSWGSHGVGRWVTIFSNSGHAYMDVAGLRLDTSAADDPSNQQGPRWRPLRAANDGYTIRHPLGF